MSWLLSRRAQHGDGRRAGELGQAALGMVLSLAVLLVTSGTILAVNAIQHDPLTQADVVEHYAYRALEAGINSYLSTINAEPSLVTCNTTSTSTTCKNSVNGITYDKWNMVPSTTSSSTAVPEYYLWTNPQLCFSSKQSLDTACTSTSASGNLEYVQILVVGAAGTSGRYKYQRSVANFSPNNGFLTHVWWSKYEAQPASKTATKTACKYDYANSYAGAGSTCTPTVRNYPTGGAVYFGPGDVVDGPVFSDDSIYVGTHPTFGTPTTCKSGVTTGCTAVYTADTGCLFVTKPGTTGSSPSNGCISQQTADVKYYTKASSKYDRPAEIPPTSDTTLKTLAAEDGCLYSGPTTISFFATTTNHTGYMDVTSPETPLGATTKDGDNSSTNPNTCLGRGHKATNIRLPTGTPTGGGAGVTKVPNGVIYVETASGSCSSTKNNPYEAVSGGVVTTTKAQIYSSGATSYNLTNTPTAANCAGDVFVRDASAGTVPTGKTTGIAGNITVGAQDNIIVTGSLKYTSCQSGFNSENVGCTYRPGGINDSLGLIASNYVTVNRPECPPGKSLVKQITETVTVKEQKTGYEKVKEKQKVYTARKHKTVTETVYVTVPYTYTVTVTQREKVTNPNYDQYCVTSGGKLMMATCTSSVSARAAAICSPGSTVTIDGAILALSHSFTVENFRTGSSSGKLIVYGAIDQYWRGAVGTFSGGAIASGYSKYYTFDKRLQYVSIPHFLTPGTSAWVLASSSVLLSTGCPAWPKPWPTGYSYIKTGVATTGTSGNAVVGKTPPSSTSSC